MRSHSHPRIVGAVVLMTVFWSETARTQNDVLADLEIGRHHAVYVSAAPAGESSVPHALVVNQWARPLRLGLIYPHIAHGDLTSQATSALEALDQRLAELGTTRAGILQLNAFVAGHKKAESARMLALISDYLDFVRPSDYHSAALYAVFQTEGTDNFERLGAAVVLMPTVLDPRTATSDQRFDLAWSYQSKAERSFLTGPVQAPARSGSQSSRAEVLSDVKVALRRARELLSQIGAGPNDVHEMTVYIDATTGVDETELRPILDEFFPHGIPLVDYVSPQVRFVVARLVSAPGGTVAIEATGTVVHSR